MLIRKEEPSDYEKVYQLVKKAFATAKHSDGGEQDLIVRLRKSNAFIPELSLVAVDGDQIIGHILFSKVKINDKTELALAPLSVLPDYQKKGVGSALIKEGHKIAADLGYEFSIVLGSENFYPKIGYKQASEFGILSPFDVPSENFMALNLQGEEILLNGMVEYAKEFAVKTPTS